MTLSGRRPRIQLAKSFLLATLLTAPWIVFAEDGSAASAETQADCGTTLANGEQLLFRYQYPEAVDVLSRAIAELDDAACRLRGRVALADAYNRLNRNQQALAEIDLALADSEAITRSTASSELAAMLAEAYFQRGIALQPSGATSRKRWNGPIEAFERALELSNDGHRKAGYALVRAYQKARRADALEALVERVPELAPREPEHKKPKFAKNLKGPDDLAKNMPFFRFDSDTSSLAAVAKAHNDLTPPQAVSTPGPSYSEAARKARVQGTVVLLALVDIDGTVADLLTVEDLSMELDKAAIEAVESWRYEPALDADGEPVVACVEITINFRL